MNFLRRKRVLLGVMFAFGLTFFTAGELFAPTEGCTPGFWKMLAKKDPGLFFTITGLTPYQKLGECSGVTGIFVFGSDETIQPFVVEQWWADIQCMTILDALKFHGGSGVQGAVQIFLRHAVAGLLNARAYEYGYIHYISMAFYPGWIEYYLLEGATRDDFLAPASLIDYYNNLGCPIDRFGSRIIWPRPTQW